MPENLTSPKQEFLESDIERIQQRLSEFKELPEARDMSEPQMVKKAVESFAPQPSGDVSTPATDEAPSDADREVEELLKTVFESGLEQAVSAASRMHPYVMDAFHDAIVGKLYRELEKRGIFGT